MFYNIYESDDYQYDTCSFKGVCSIDPVTTSLQEVIMSYLRVLSFYVLKLNKLGATSQNVKNLIINTLAELVSNTDYTQEQFKYIISLLYKELFEAKAVYESICDKNNLKKEKLPSNFKPLKKFNISSAIRQGEKEFSNNTKKFSSGNRQLIELNFIIIRSICRTLIELKAFGDESHQIYLKILKFINLFNDANKIDAEVLTNSIKEFSLINYESMCKSDKLKQEMYGQMQESVVSFSTRPNKAILVSGVILKELEKVLEAVKDMENIDVYTHGSMILAHTFPEFKKYPNLKAQFGVGVENCLLDFATFPGAILMTKNSLQNVEYLYRGRLFTTDFNPPRGVIQIKNDDYSPLINSALEAKGFHKGQEREPLKIGYFIKDIELKAQNIIENYEKNRFKHLVIFASIHNNPQKTKYFKEFSKIASKEIFISKLFENINSKNIFQLTSFYDFWYIFKLLEKLNEYSEYEKFKVSVFMTKCDKYTIPNLLKLVDFKVANIFLANCSTALINPVLVDKFKSTFDIKNFTVPKDDLDYILSTFSI